MERSWWCAYKERGEAGMERVGRRGEQPVAITRYGEMLRRVKVATKGSHTPLVKMDLGHWWAHS